MLKDSNDADLSELEREFELEMDDLEFEYEGNPDEESGDEEYGDQEYGDQEYEEDQMQEYEGSDEETSDYAQRFYELSQMEFESESELDQEMDGLLSEMEQEYFFGGVGKFLKSKAKGLVKKGFKYAVGRIPALQALKNMTHLSRLNLTGLLKTFGKPLLEKALAATPQGAIALTALKALGHEATEDSEVDREVWDNYVQVCKEAYEHLADNLNENADHPLEASRLATNAFQKALINRRRMGHRRRFPHGRRFMRGGVARGGIVTGAPHSRGKKQVFYIDPDVEIVVLRKKR
jgi:hypothetical protein